MHELGISLDTSLGIAAALLGRLHVAPQRAILGPATEEFEDAGVVDFCFAVGPFLNR